MLRAGVIGYGYWGPNIVRNFKSSGAFDVAVVCDQSTKQLQKVQEAHPGTRTTTDLGDVLGDARIDAVAIITPVATHFDVAMRALRAGKHVWIEKPVTASSDEARELLDEATKRRLTVFVDHTFVYTGAVQQLRKLNDADEIGGLVAYDSVRTNLGLYRPDVNVLWDLAVHDVSILNFAFGARTIAVSATGIANVPNMPESSAHMTCFLDGGALMHVHADWFAPVKGRTTTITGDKRMIVYDDNEPVEKVRVYDRGIDVTPSVDGRPPAIGYRQGAYQAPELEKLEALSVAAKHFAGSIEQGTRPTTDGEFGLRIVEVLEAAALSMKQRGQPIALRS